MDQSKIDRINELANKSKISPLNQEEIEEQSILRKEFIVDFRKNFISTLDTIKIQDEKGNIRPLKNKG